MLSMNIIPVSSGQEIELQQCKIKDNTRFYLHPFSVSHGGHPSLGYTILSRKIVPQGLKDEYKGMDGKQLGALARSGVTIKNPSVVVERFEVCYTGDTGVEGLVNRCTRGGGDGVNGLAASLVEDDGGDAGVSWERLSLRYLREGFMARLILCELTFLDPSDREKARQRGHLNIMDIEPILRSHGWDFAEERQAFGSEGTNADALIGGGKLTGACGFSRNATLVFFHVSRCHRTVERILDEIYRSLPSKILAMSEAAIASFCHASTDLTLLKTNGCVSLSDYCVRVQQ